MRESWLNLNNRAITNEMFILFQESITFFIAS